MIGYSSSFPGFLQLIAVKNPTKPLIPTLCALIFQKRVINVTIQMVKEIKIIININKSLKFN